jgi:uncharacterized protein YabN with tetrapyrrole methylase and pyrophosphatase domain
MANDKETEQKFGELLDVMARLRGETGCPWDKEQTHTSLCRACSKKPTSCSTPWTTAIRRGSKKS